MEDNEAWKRAHEEFVKTAINRKMVMAINSGHFIMADKPGLAVAEIVIMVYSADKEVDKGAGHTQSRDGSTSRYVWD